MKIAEAWLVLVSALYIDCIMLVAAEPPEEEVAALYKLLQEPLVCTHEASAFASELSEFWMVVVRLELPVFSEPLEIVLLYWVRT